jgi:hypothetical protein
MDENTSQIDEALLYELALRLTAYPGDLRVDEPQLLVGVLPPNLSNDVPVPEDSRILGSLIRSPEHIDIVLDCTLSPESVMQFYRERLLAAGWNELDSFRPPNTGFVTSRLSALQNNLIFCRGLQGPAFMIIALPGKNDRTDVRINLNAGEHSPCADPNRRRRTQRGMHDLIPTLFPPQGANQQGGGGSGGTGSWYTSATLQSDLDIPELASHYHKQLVKGGWKMNGVGQDGPLAWSTWTFQDEEKTPWNGLFFILKTPGKEGQYILEARVEWEKKDNGGKMKRLLQGGWFSSYGPLS